MRQAGSELAELGTAILGLPRQNVGHLQIRTLPKIAMRVVEVLQGFVSQIDGTEITIHKAG